MHANLQCLLTQALRLPLPFSRHHLSYHGCLEHKGATRCITVNVLQTKVDAQYDKLATELSWQRLRRLTFSNYSELLVEVANFNLPHLHLAPPLKVTQFKFCQYLRHRKLDSLSYRVALFAWYYVYIAMSVEHGLVHKNRRNYLILRVSLSQIIMFDTPLDFLSFKPTFYVLYIYFNFGDNIMPVFYYRT